MILTISSAYDAVSTSASAASGVPAVGCSGTESTDVPVADFSSGVLVDRKSISYTNWWFKIFHLVLPMVDDRCLIDFIEIFVDTIN